MPHITNHRWTLEKRPTPGPLDHNNYRFSEEVLSELAEGQFVVKNLMLSFDPSQRFWMERDSYIPAIKLGDVVQSVGYGEVIASKNTDFPEGARVSGLLGWQEYKVVRGDDPMPPMRLPEGVSPEAALSVLGLTGLTAYFGMTDIAQVKKGETVVVSGAAGATGSIAAQIARIHGAHTIGIAGGEEKCQWLKEKAKLDAQIDYKSSNVREELKALAPKGIDVFYDNVGGPILDAALELINFHGRVALCGGISFYDGVQDGSIKNYLNLVLKSARMEGFLITTYVNRYPEAVGQLSAWLAQGLLHYEVDVQKGIENAPSTLDRIYTGQNLGKQLLSIQH